MHPTKIVIFFLLLTAGLMAQTTERPKIGLVLSGGSAHGLSHIGVLKYLEEKGIRVDYITGTSMGSIIGGLYAMGLSADEIEQVASEQDWEALLSTTVPLRQIAPVEKQYHDKYALTLEYDSDGLRLPLGFFNSQNLDLTLNRLFRSARNINDFDDLPYPFRCLTVDIENGEIVELNQGFLGNAVRASMAIPSVFTPVELDDHLLVDGGLIRNFPVQEVLAMGADIVIGVYVGSKLEDKDNLNSLIDILNQSAFMMGILDSEEQKELTDILIEPDVKELPNFGFDLYDQLIREGYFSARSQEEKIDSIAGLLSAYDLSRPDKLEAPESIHLGGTRFPYVREPFNALARFKYGVNRQGDTSFDRIEKGISRIFGTKHFETINYTFSDGEGGVKIMDVLAQPREVKALSFGLNFMPSTGTSLIMTNELRNIFSKPSVLYTTLRIAENYGALIDYQYRLGEKKDFLFSVSALGHRYQQELFEGEIVKERLSEIQVVGRVGVNYEPNNVLMGSGYVAVDNIMLNPRESRDNDFAGYDRLDFRGGLGLNINTLDELQFPNEGINFMADLSYHINASETLENDESGLLAVPERRNYVSSQAKLIGYYPLIEQVVISGHVNAGYKSNESLTNNYRVGGLENRGLQSISMIGFNVHQLHFSKYAQLGGALRLRIGSSLHASIRADLITGDRTFMLTTANPVDKSVSILGTGAIFSLKTPAGPLHVSIGRNDLSNEWNTNFTFGYSFF